MPLIFCHTINKFEIKNVIKVYLQYNNKIYIYIYYISKYLGTTAELIQKRKEIAFESNCIWC